MDNALPVAAHIGEARPPDPVTDVGTRACFVTGVQIEHPCLTAIVAKVDASDTARAIASCRPTNFRHQEK